MSIPAEVLMTARIDRESPVPYYYQLREIIRNEMVGNRLVPGDMLPSERELSEGFGVSRPTVREALDSLVLGGLLRREKGVGTFVADPKFQERWSGPVVGFSDSLQTQGLALSPRVLSLSVVSPDAQVREDLFLGSEEKVIALRRLRSIAAEPILVTESFLPESLFPGLADVDFTSEGLYQTLRTKYGAKIVRVRRAIESVGATDEIARLLGLAPGGPVMYIENTAYSERGPIEFYFAWRRGDRSRFEFEYSVSST